MNSEKTVKNLDRELKDLALSLRTHPSKRIILYNKLKTLFNNCSNISLIDKRKLLNQLDKGYSGVMDRNDLEWFTVLSKIGYHITGENFVITHSNPICLYTKTENGSDAILTLGAVSYCFSQYEKNPPTKTAEIKELSKLDIFKNKLFEIVNKYGNGNAYYNELLKNDYSLIIKLSKKSDEITNSELNNMKHRIVRLYTVSRLSKRNEELDDKLSFLSIDSLLSKYNEIVNDLAKQIVADSARDRFINQYGVESIIKDGNKAILKELDMDSELAIISSSKYEKTDLVRATEYMPVSQVIIACKNVAKSAKYRKKHDERSFEIFKEKILPRLIYLIKKRLVDAGVALEGNEEAIKAEICDSVLGLEGIYRDYSKSYIGIKEIILNNEYSNKKKDFESISVFGVLKNKQKQIALGMPKYERIF